MLGGLTFTAIAAGRFILGDFAEGAAYCWGSAGGQLGYGDIFNRSTPTAVTGGLTFRHYLGGWEYTCGLTSSGAGYCWGQNINGNLGDGTTETRLVPTAVVGGLTFLGNPAS